MSPMLRRFLYVLAVLQIPHPGAFAESAVPEYDSELDQELKFLAAERQIIVTASKLEERVDKTIATTTVITRDDMRRMGARNLLDALRLTPGLGVTQTTLGIREIEVRGVKTLFSEKVLFLLNGHPLDHNLQNAGSTWVYDDLPVDTIQRIEVVRGPGSALYGANAFLAVINVITQSAKDLNGVETSAGWGSFDTQQYRASWGKQFDNNAEAAVHFNFTDTNGIGAPVPEDRLTLQGLKSLAPGLSQLTERRYDLEWNLGYQGFILDGRYINKRMGAFVGVDYVLSDRSDQDYENYFLRLSRSWSVRDDLTINTSIYRDFFSFDNLLQPDPSKFVRVAATNTRAGGQLESVYRGAANNTLIAGFSYMEEEQYGVTQETGPSPKQLTTSKPFSGNASRSRWGVYAQDVWDVFETLRLTLGARYDEYSDFGGTFNPRLGFNWEFIKDYSLKFSYGTGYRAPVFGELLVKNNPLLAGNPDLAPEEVDTFEAGLIAHPVPGLTTQAVFYHSRIGKIIGLIPVLGSTSAYRYDNGGSIVSEGVELEGRYDFGEDFQGSYVVANYVYQNPTQNGQRVSNVPHNRANFMLNWAFDSYWSGLAHVLVKSSTARAAGDARSDVPGYAVLNLSLLSRNLLWKGVDVGFTMYNVLDKKYFDPAPMGAPIDYQQAERAYFGHVSLKF
jgi:outer membrane receptor protein involved in Fe transport